jgi:hypothetical protein
MVEAWVVSHFTFKNDSVLCIPANLSQLLGTPRVWPMVHECALPERRALLPKLWFSILIIPVYALLGSCIHKNTIHSACSQDGQYICFNPIYHPWEQWLEVHSFTSTEALINCTWVNDPNKHVSIYFDVYATITESMRPWGNCGG